VKNKKSNLRENLREIIFEADTPAGKAFDVALLILISLSVFAVMLDSVPSIHQNWGAVLLFFEWGFTIVFTIEYLLRIYTAHKSLKYIFSFFGIIDLLAILPTYISLILAGSRYLIVIRILRLLRIFRILKLARFMKASEVLKTSLKESRHKIIVFLEVVLTSVVVMGSFMYLIEGPENGFTSIPRAIYWAIVTLTTVGYGDIAPSTTLGQSLAACIMILGYAIIAVPTGIITVEMSKVSSRQKKQIYSFCKKCNKQMHDEDAAYCKYCGSKLENKTDI